MGLVEKMISFLFIVPSSMGATVSALTAQNAGAGKGDRARQVLKDAMTISVVYGCLITVLMWLVAPTFIGFFAKDPAVVAAGTGICTVIFLMQSLPASTFALVAFSLHTARATSALRTTCWPWRSFACRARGCCRTLFRHAVPHGHRLAVRFDFVGSHLYCRVYRAQPARGF